LVQPNLKGETVILIVNSNPLKNPGFWSKAGPLATLSADVDAHPGPASRGKYRGKAMPSIGGIAHLFGILQTYTEAVDALYGV
jgi:hypothetical protein